MKIKTFLIICTLLISSIANAADNKFVLTYQKQNHWVAKEDLKSLINAVVFFKNNNLKIQATCSKQDTFCNERITILNHIFEKQNVQQNISSTITAEQNKNTIILENINLDPSKYLNYILTYENKNILPTDESNKKFDNILKTAEEQYLSQFKMFCKQIDETCKNRFNQLNSKIAKTLTFMYNFVLYENNSLEENTVQIVNHRHDYKINNPVNKPIITNKEIKTTIKHDDVENYTKNPNIIVFKNNESELLLLEKVKIEKLIHNSKNNKFMFACGTDSQALCQARVHSIKNYALQNTNNIIIMQEYLQKTAKNYIIVK